MGDDPLDYARLVQRALVSVVRDTLRIVSSEGLPGEHHLYLTFRTTDAGVRLPARLRAEYPQEMTIVLQHLFWELAVDEEKFSVKLRFGGTPEHVEVPFAALTAFVDPSAHFGLRFEPASALAPAGDSPADVKPAGAKARPQPVARRERPALRAATPAPTPAKRGPRAPAAVPRPVTPASGTKVVDLAAFRKSVPDRAGNTDDAPGGDDDDAS